LAPQGQRRPRGRILYSLLLLLLAVGSVPLLWVSFMLVSDTRERLEVELKTLQLATAQSLSERIKLFVGSLESQVRSVAQMVEVGAGSRAFSEHISALSANRALERFVDPFGPLPIYAVNVVNTSCLGIGTQAEGFAAGPAVESFMQEGCVRGRDGRAMISKPVMAASASEPVLVISFPIAPGGRVQGVVLAVASLRPVLTMTMETQEMGGRGVDVYVVDDRGWLVAHSDPARLAGDRDVSQIEIVKLFLQSRGRASSTEPFSMPGPEGHPLKMLGTHTSVRDESGWGVIVQVSEAQAYAGVYDARRRSLSMVVAVTLIALLLGVVFAGRLTHPIDLLARGARQLASGDYGTRVSVKSTNEVGVLAGAFNHMGEEIQKAIEEVRRAAALNKELFVGSIRMLANAIDEKDPYTRGHSDRVAYYAKLISQHLGMSEQEVERVYLSGILHDVGKIGIEDKILRKAEALTDDEYDIMKQHTKKGEYILAAVPVLRDLTGDGLKHHENVDGSGYPDRLQGDAIPLLGRIISVADAFDAMTTDRPYSKAWTFERALARLRELAGKKFDDAAVGAMEKAFAAGDLAAEKIRAVTMRTAATAAN
jgi:HD-GYP domain-containing protein (c-di-GMP phosphodiesterase class II)